MKTLLSRNPYTGETIEEFQPTSPLEIERKLARAQARFESDRPLGHGDRARRLQRLALQLERFREDLARAAVAEMGKTLTAARAEIDKCALTARWFSERLEVLLKDEPLPTPRQYVRPLPLGPILAVMPWNFPFWQAMRAAIPALGAGNTMLLKHASNVSRCALWIERVFAEAGWPEGAFQTLLIDSSRVADVIGDPRIRGVTLTGSEAAGRAIGAEAGRHLKKTVLELGGSDPFLVLPSADMPATAAAAAQARTVNNGQSCIAAKRFIVHEKIYDAFIDRFKTEMSALRLGDPLEEATQIGPLVHAEALKGLSDQVERAQAAGATTLLAPKIEHSHNLFSPAILGVPEADQDPVFQEEFFGPVALVMKARTLDHAIEIANRSRFGLGSSVWTRDPDEALYAIDRLEAGLTFVNKIVASEPQMPFGGVKNSGLGRELGRHGIHEFVNMKSVAYGAEL